MNLTGSKAHSLMLCLRGCCPHSLKSDKLLTHQWWKNLFLHSSKNNYARQRLQFFANGVFVSRTSSLLVSVSALLLFPRPNYLSSHQSLASWFWLLRRSCRAISGRNDEAGEYVLKRESGRDEFCWGGRDQGLGRVVRARHRIPRGSQGNVMWAGRGCWKWGQEGSTVTLATTDVCTSR